MPSPCWSKFFKKLLELRRVASLELFIEKKQVQSAFSNSVFRRSQKTTTKKSRQMGMLHPAGLPLFLLILSSKKEYLAPIWASQCFPSCNRPCPFLCTYYKKLKNICFLFRYCLCSGLQWLQQQLLSPTTGSLISTFFFPSLPSGVVSLESHNLWWGGDTQMPLAFPPENPEPIFSYR